MKAVDYGTFLSNGQICADKHAVKNAKTLCPIDFLLTQIWNYRKTYRLY